MPVEPMMEQPGVALAVEEAGAERRADDVDIAEHDRRARQQPGDAGSLLAKGRRFAACRRRSAAAGGGDRFSPSTSMTSSE